MAWVSFFCALGSATRPPHNTLSIIIRATQIFGGYGFMDETLVARHYRDSKVLEIGEGTSEVQRLVISRGLGLPVE